MEHFDTDSVIRYVGESKQQVIDSRDVARMIGKTHRHLMRDIRGYINDMEDSPKLDSPKFFIESSYISAQNKELPCYLLTKQGCEFVANKLTGRKGTIFTATYVSLFNEYEAEHNGKAVAIDSGLEHEKLAYKREWLIEMRKQNVKLYLELGKVADDYQRPHMAVDFRNEAIRAMQALPVGARREYSATEIGNMIGVSPIAIGRTIDINEFRRKYCGGKSAPWVRLYIFDKFPETDFANGGWVIAPHATSGVKKSIIFEYEASRWIEAHKREIDWSAKI